MPEIVPVVPARATGHAETLLVPGLDRLDRAGQFLGAAKDLGGRNHLGDEAQLERLLPSRHGVLGREPPGPAVALQVEGLGGQGEKGRGKREANPGASPKSQDN